MMDWELAQQVARTQGVGLADMLYRQLSAYLAQQHGDGARTQAPKDE
jgi:Rod binding domain-containing protein